MTTTSVNHPAAVEGLAATAMVDVYPPSRLSSSHPRRLNTLPNIDRNSVNNRPPVMTLQRLKTVGDSGQN